MNGLRTIREHLTALLGAVALLLAFPVAGLMVGLDASVMLMIAGAGDWHDHAEVRAACVFVGIGFGALSLGTHALLWWDP